MPDYQDETVGRPTVRRPEVTAGEEVLLERAIGDMRSLTAPEEPSLLRPQQHRNAVWRWHVRRRQRQS
jgi:hypothetical protein